MEKFRAHRPLPLVKQLIGEGLVRATFTATKHAEALGFSAEDMFDVVLALKAADFYKSMTTYADNSVWQDVYHAQTPVGPIYLKLTVINDVLIVAFKEL